LLDLGVRELRLLELGILDFRLVKLRLLEPTVHRKKRLATFPSPVGMSLTEKRAQVRLITFSIFGQLKPWTEPQVKTAGQAQPVA
jgi:hypothetical protein